MSRGEFTVALVGRRMSEVHPLQPDGAEATRHHVRPARDHAGPRGRTGGVRRPQIPSRGHGGVHDGRGGRRPPSEDPRQVLRAVYESDLVVFLVDSRDGLLPSTRRSPGCCANGEAVPARSEQGGREGGREGVTQFHALSVETIHAVSAEHGTGVAELLETIVERIPTGSRRGTGGGEGRRTSAIAIVGRPNVGKSTLVNTLAGFERVIASEIPGTTRDAIDVLVERDGRKYLLIDTAGIRAKRKTEGAVEIFSVMKSLDSIKRCDLAVLLIDGPGGLTHQDRQVLRYILDEERAVVVAANKADGWATEEARRKGLHTIAEGLEYASFAPVVATVATSGKGFQPLFRKIEEASANFRMRVPTGLLNRMAQSFLYTVPILPRRGGTAPST